MKSLPSISSFKQLLFPVWLRFTLCCRIVSLDLISIGFPCWSLSIGMSCKGKCLLRFHSLQPDSPNDGFCVFRVASTPTGVVSASFQAEAQTENKLFRLKVKEVSRVARVWWLVDAFTEAAFWGTEFAHKCSLLQSAGGFNSSPSSKVNINTFGFCG